MAKNPIQFQKGLSLTEFLAQYGDESKCYQALFAFRWPRGFVYPRCGQTGHCQIASRKLLQYNYCHVQTSLIAGTEMAPFVWTSFTASKVESPAWLRCLFDRRQHYGIRLIGHLLL